MYFRCIVLVEVLRKSTTGIIIKRPTKVIQYHDSQSEFQMGSGMRNTTLKAKLIHNVYHDGGGTSRHFLGPPDVLMDRGLGSVPRRPGWIRHGTMYTLALEDVMDFFADGGEGWRILCPTLPGILCIKPR